jgi:hypothetical protein
VVEVVRPADGAIVAQAKPVFSSETSGKTLTPDEPASGLWHVEGMATGKLTPGGFLVRARLQAQRDGSSAGDVESDPLPLQVLVDSSSAQSAQQRTLALAAEAALAGNLEESARLLDGALSAQPDSVNVLIARGNLCRRGGDVSGAVICLDRALQVVEAQADRQPPTGLIELADQLDLTAKPADGAVTPGWARLPENLRVLLSKQPMAAGK